MQDLTLLTDEKLFEAYNALLEEEVQELSMDASGDCTEQILMVFQKEAEPFLQEFSRRDLIWQQEFEMEHLSYDSI